MFCTNCGNQINTGSKFCTRCGNTVENLVAKPVSFEAPKTKRLFGSSTQTKENNPIGYNKPTTNPTTPWTPSSVARKINTSRVVRILVVLAFVGYGIYSNLDKSSVETNNTGIDSFDSGNHQQAINQFQQATNDAITNETKITTLKNLAYVYSTDSKNDLALSTFKQALALTSPDSFDYYLITAEVALLQGDSDSAALNYNKAYQLNPDYFQINNALGLFYLNLDDTSSKYEDYKRALPYAKKAYEVSKLEIAKANLAIAYYFNENYTQTISLLSSADTTGKPYDAYWLGLAYARNDDPVNAKIYLQKAISGGVKVPQEVYNYIDSH